MNYYHTPLQAVPARLQLRVCTRHSNFVAISRPEAASWGREGVDIKWQEDERNLPGNLTHCISASEASQCCPPPAQVKPGTVNMDGVLISGSGKDFIPLIPTGKQIPSWPRVKAVGPWSWPLPPPSAEAKRMRGTLRPKPPPMSLWHRASTQGQESSTL